MPVPTYQNTPAKRYEANRGAAINKGVCPPLPRAATPRHLNDSRAIPLFETPPNYIENRLRLLQNYRPRPIFAIPKCSAAPLNRRCSCYICPLYGGGTGNGHTALNSRGHLNGGLFYFLNVQIWKTKNRRAARQQPPLTTAAPNGQTTCRNTTITCYILPLPPLNYQVGYLRIAMI